LGFSDLADRALKAVRNVLGEDVTYNPSAGDPLTIKGVFNKQHIEIDPGGSVSVSSNRPNLLIRLADLENEPTKSDTVEIDATEYAVVDCQEDGEGGALLFLNEV
jgi:hypothetical protein